MAADFRLIAHSTQSKPDKLAAGGPCDRHTQGGFAHARRSNKTENRSFGFLYQLAYGEELENAVLDLVEAVMIFVQNLFGQFDIADFPGLLLPGHREQPVDVIARYGRLRRHWRHHLDSAKFLMRLLIGILRHAGYFDLAPQFLGFGFFVLLAEFLLDRLDLFVEVVLFLGAFHLALHAILDGPIDLKLLELLVEYFCQALAALYWIEHFDELLFFLDGEYKMGANDVGHTANFVNLNGGENLFGVRALAELKVLLELLCQVRGQRVIASESLMAER